MNSEEEYYPVEPNYYNYKALANLESNIDDYLTEYDINEIYLCGYEVNNEYKYPFLKYLLFKNIFTNILELPKMVCNPFMNSKQLIKATSIFMMNMLESEGHDDNFIGDIVFKGFLVKQFKIYIFYDLTKTKIEVNDLYKSNCLWPTLVSEIVNDQHICNFEIDINTTYFFTENSDFCFLHDEKENNYILPTVGYVGKHIKKLSFTHVFGNPKSEANILGNYYYFTDYKNAIRQGGWSPDGKPEYFNSYNLLLTENEFGKYKQGGIVRFALFLDNMKIIENLPYNPCDESKIKSNRLTDTNLDTNYERLTMRISDYDGKWGDDFDSVYLGKNIELDNGDQIKNTPIIVVKHYNQQVPLSYHHIDKHFLKERFDENSDYFIV